MGHGGPKVLERNNEGVIHIKISLIFCFETFFLGSDTWGTHIEK
jgi:hypothetical protein